MTALPSLVFGTFTTTGFFVFIVVSPITYYTGFGGKIDSFGAFYLGFVFSRLPGAGLRIAVGIVVGLLFLLPLLTLFHQVVKLFRGADDVILFTDLRRKSFEETH
jgi:hypothetical protein